MNKDVRLPKMYNFRKYLYNIDTQSMTLNTKHEWVPSAEDADYCYGEINKFKDCNSYVRSAIRMSDSSFRVCASSAKQPSCRKLLLINVGFETIDTAC